MASCFCVLLSYSLAFARSSLFSTFDFFPFPAHPNILYYHRALVLLLVKFTHWGWKSNWFAAIEDNYVYQNLRPIQPTLQILVFVKTIIYGNVIVSFIGIFWCRTKGNPRVPVSRMLRLPVVIELAIRVTSLGVWANDWNRK